MSEGDLEGRPTRAEIRLGALGRNFARARELAGPGVKVMAVVKADAYGHGMIRVARELVAQGAEFLGVAIIEEAVQLRRQGIQTPILVLGSPPRHQLRLFARHDVDLAVTSTERAREAAQAAAEEGKSIRIHVKIDTGMGRIGVKWKAVEAFAEELGSYMEGKGKPGLRIIGAFSHLATSDCDLDFAREQEARFRGALDSLAKKGLEAPIPHLENSAGLVNMPEARFGMVRPGIFVYGYEPSPWRSVGLEPVMRLVSQLSFVKDIRAGESVSYGRTWIAEEDSRIATVPIGYGDGYSRALSNRAKMWTGGSAHPVRGRVCMDQTMLELGRGCQAKEGDEVIVFGKRGEEGIAGEELCQLLGTIPYELTCMVGSRVPRVYVED